MGEYRFEGGHDVDGANGDKRARFAKALRDSVALKGAIVDNSRFVPLASSGSKRPAPLQHQLHRTTTDRNRMDGSTTNVLYTHTHTRDFTLHQPALQLCCYCKRLKSQSRRIFVKVCLFNRILKGVLTFYFEGTSYVV
jgi:hypothetical protein